MNVLDMLNRLLRGHRFTPTQYLSLGGRVKEVIDTSDMDSGTNISVIFENPTDGVDGRYVITDLSEDFTIQVASFRERREDEKWSSQNSGSNASPVGQVPQSPS